VDKYYSVAEISDAIGVSRNAINRLIYLGILKTYKWHSNQDVAEKYESLPSCYHKGKTNFISTDELRRVAQIGPINPELKLKLQKWLEANGYEFKTSLTADSPISMLGLDMSIINPLLRYNIRTIRDLIVQYGDGNGLNNISTLGPKKIQKIEYALIGSGILNDMYANDIKENAENRIPKVSSKGERLLNYIEVLYGEFNDAEINDLLNWIQDIERTANHDFKHQKMTEDLKVALNNRLEY